MSAPTPSVTVTPHSLWMHTAPNEAPNPPLVGDLEVDVTVISAGYTGLRTALALAETGTRVAIVDAGDVGAGASGRTGGQVNPMLPFSSPAKVRKLVGNKTFDRLADASLNSADEIFDLIKTYQIECQARQKGWLRVHHNRAAHRQSEADIRNWNALGAEMELVDAEKVVTLSGSHAYQSGMVNPRGGAVQPLMFARGLAAAAKNRGVQIFGKSAVQSLAKTADTWTTHISGGRITSDWIVVATNGYSDELVPNLARSVLPITPIQIATDPLPDDVIDDVLPNGHTISDSRRVIMYARREPDNRMVYGGHGQPDKNGHLAGFDWLKKDAERVFPQLKGLNWSFRWGGRIAVTDDHLPHLHEPQKGLIIGLGYNGRGVAMSNVMGRVIAERILGAAPDSLPFPVTDVAAIPMRNLKVLGMPICDPVYEVPRLSRNALTGP